MQNAQAFEQYLLVRRGLQPVTVAGYVGAARRFSKVIGEYPTVERIEQYVYDFYSSGYSYAHKTNTVLALERYTEFLGRPIRLGRQKKPRSIVKDTLTEAEVTKLIFSCKNLKQKAILALLAYSGIRNKELCGLKIKDFDAGRNTIRVIQGKGLKDGISMVSAECTRILLEYLTLSPRESGDYFFKTYQGRQFSGFALRKLVKVVARRAGMTKRIYPHLLRHSLAVNMLVRGAHIMTLKNQLRHSLLETTLTYINSIVFGSRNDYDKVAPSYL